MLNKISNFFNLIQQNKIELYSEFGLQHELAIFLRNHYPDLTVKLEYPTSIIFNDHPKLIKKEIDIYIIAKDGKKYVIELKMPKDNCGTPNEMYRAVQDVKFLEQLKQLKINGCYSILLTKRKAFWEAPRANSGIYKLFNGEKVIIHSLNLPQLPGFLHNKGSVLLNNKYVSNWNIYTDKYEIKWKYYILEVH